jgi:hypothetical protein
MNTSYNPHNAPECVGDQALVLRSSDARFSVYKTEGRERGARGAAPPSLYCVHDVVTGKLQSLRNLKEINCLIHFRITGEQTLPWFKGTQQCLPVEAPKAALVPAGDRINA